MRSLRTPSQTVGPFFHFGLVAADLLVAPGDAHPVRIEGAVLDGAGAGVPDAVVELFDVTVGFGRSLTDTDGRYRFVASKPPPRQHPDGTTEAPHFDVSVFARGLLQRVATRVYFPDDADNAADAVLRSLGDDASRLVATPAADGVRFDIHLQGPEETPFFVL